MQPFLLYDRPRKMSCNTALFPISVQHQDLFVPLHLVVISQNREAPNNDLPLSMDCFANCTTGEDLEAIWWAVAIAAGNSSSPEQVLAMRPRFSSSAPVSVEEVRIMSIAFCFPKTRVSRCVPPAPGIVPTANSGKPNFASMVA